MVMLEILSQVEGGWSEFGLAGLVISALFTGLFFTAKGWAAFVSQIVDVHLKERQEWREWGGKQLDLHRQERDEWRAQMSDEERLNRQAIEKLVDAVEKGPHDG